MRAQRIRGDLKKPKSWIKKNWTKNYVDGVKKTTDKVRKATETVKTNILEKTPITDMFEKL